ncbi:heparinase II/III domain-containing protein [Spirosoma sp.]|uniref:heparinase II/III domain-containing protein n=1 Tax=Spirosoma sp. TaxID=1899569 RepID=UPI003B3B2DC5
MSKIGLLWRTIRCLTIRQIVYQIWNRFRSRPRLYLPRYVPRFYFLTAVGPCKPISWRGDTYTFLNQPVTFLNKVDWNYADYGKLWTYNLNYFDFLNQANVTSETGLSLIRDFIGQTNQLRDGLESYPTSLRIINWAHFLSRHHVQDAQINSHLFAQTQLLSRRLEYHLAGNHLLENGFALLTGATYFRHKGWFQKASAIVYRELAAQILADGCHDERSPMYHQILLDRLLDVLLILQYDPWHNDSKLTTFLTQKAACMLGWLHTITFRNGDVPMVNDSAFGVAPATFQLRKKAEQLGISSTPLFPFVAKKKDDSGYYMFRQNRYELFVDIGAVGPNHQPGHAHADTFSFLMYVDNCPVIVDSGTSTYQNGQRRQRERSTAAHNTVSIADDNSSEVWAGFRVGRRARVAVLTSTENTITARHDGYTRSNIIHERSWVVESSRLIIIDRLLSADGKAFSAKGGIARFYFHPDVVVQVADEWVMAGPVQLSFLTETKPELCVTTYAMAEGFNQLRSGRCIEIAFTKTLKTTLTLLNENTLP